MSRRYEVPPAEDALTINGPNSPLNGNRAGKSVDDLKKIIAF